MLLLLLFCFCVQIIIYCFALHASIHFCASCAGSLEPPPEEFFHASIHACASAAPPLPPAAAAAFAFGAAGAFLTTSGNFGLLSLLSVILTTNAADKTDAMNVTISLSPLAVDLFSTLLFWKPSASPGPDRVNSYVGFG